MKLSLLGLYKGTAYSSFMYPRRSWLLQNLLVSLLSGGYENDREGTTDFTDYTDFIFLCVIGEIRGWDFLKSQKIFMITKPFPGAIQGG